MTVKVTLVDINAKMVKAWREVFEENPEVTIVQGSMLDQQVDAWVSPTNSQGSMDGGLDGVIRNHLGQQIQNRLKYELQTLFKGSLPLGHATCVPSGSHNPKFLISTPTMHSSSEDISDSLNTALACAAAFQMVHMQNRKQPGSISSIALPGLGANTGRVPVEICADLMWTGYNLFRERQCQSFDELRGLLEDELGELGDEPAPKKSFTPKKASKPVSQKSGPPAPSAQKPVVPQTTSAAQDDDFDDF